MKAFRCCRGNLEDKGIIASGMRGKYTERDVRIYLSAGRRRGARVAKTRDKLLIIKRIDA